MSIEDYGLSLEQALTAAGKGILAERVIKHRVAYLIVHDPGGLDPLQVERWDGEVIKKCNTLRALKDYLRKQAVSLKAGWEVREVSK